MTRQEIVGALEANITFAKDGAAELLRYVERLPASPEQAHVLKEVLLLQLVRALSDDDQERQRPVG